MANNFYGAVGVSGGADGFLDNIDGTNLADADGTIVISSASNVAGLYVLDADSATAQSVPSIIQPDTNAGDKRWLLRALQMTGLDLYEPGTTNLFQFSQSAGDVIMDNTFDGGTITLRGENSGNSTMLVADPAGSVALYYDNLLAMKTTAFGVEVRDTSGTSANIGFRDSSGNTMGNVNVQATSMSHQIGAAAENAIKANLNGSVELYYNDIKEAETASGALKATNSLTIASTTNVTGILDEDDLTSDSATALATQQSIKAYVDTEKPNGNIVINGGMRIAQRGTTFTTPSVGDYTLDRWAYSGAGGHTVNVFQSTRYPEYSTTGVLGARNSINMQCASVEAAVASGDHCLLTYAVEGYDAAPLFNEWMTFSFQIRSSKTGTMGVSFQNGTATKSYIEEITINAIDTWEKKTMTINKNELAGTWDFTNGAGMLINFCFMAGDTYHGTTGSWLTADEYTTSNQTNFMDNTDNNLWITEVKLEKEQVATPYTYRPFEQELALCQRYFQIDVFGAGGSHTSGQNLVGCVGLPVTMRAEPTAANEVDAVLYAATNCGTTSNFIPRESQLTMYRGATGTGTVQYSGSVELDAEL